ncbi:hypothetical protein DPMN_125934 [Dreissena polymorpha]|uniref:Uncharacterized protein n=1 Tax=Dreissena polymorpha TaxID=45954 RepID=A0A9D4JU05_DREPO|nr:hypothetical protein DPMN_125934 [Dreissena polymorpha]
MHETCMELLRLRAIGLGISEESFTDLFIPNPCWTLRIMYNPPWEGEPPEYANLEDNKLIAIPEHTDSDFMNLLTPFHFGGLEIMQANGTWAAV